VHADEHNSDQPAVAQQPVRGCVEDSVKAEAA